MVILIFLKIYFIECWTFKARCFQWNYDKYSLDSHFSVSFSRALSEEPSLFFTVLENQKKMRLVELQQSFPLISSFKEV